MANSVKTEKQRIAEVLKWVKKEKLPNLDDILPFIPNKGLVENERRILAAMTVPGIARESVTVQAAWAGMHRHTWTTHAKKSEFQEYVVKYLRSLLNGAAPAVLHSFIHSAYLGSPQKPYGDIQAQQRILEQAQILDSQSRTGTSVQVNVVVVNQTREQNIKTGLSRFGFTVSDN